MKVLIIGGNRFVGKAVAERFMNGGHHVTVYNRSGSGPEGVTILKEDRNTDQNKLYGYDLVIDFCLFKPDQAVRLLEQLKDGQPYIFISSASAYADTDDLLLRDDSPIKGLTGFGDYGKEKAQCEEIIQKSKLTYSIIRPPYVIGPGSHRPRLSYYFNQIINNKPVHVDGDGQKLLTFIWVDDLVKFIYSAGINLFTGTVNSNSQAIANPSIYSSEGLIAEVASFLNKKYKITQNGPDAPFPNHHLIVNTLPWLQPIKDKLPEFYHWFITEGKQKHGYE